MAAEKKWLSLLDVTWEAPSRNTMKVLFNHFYVYTYIQYYVCKGSVVTLYLLV